jgi:hypothetical protein
MIMNQPSRGPVFVASATVQVVANDRLKLGAAFQLEQLRGGKHDEHIELWRFAAEDTPDAAAALGDRFASAVTEQLEPALAAFDDRRGEDS